MPIADLCRRFRDDLRGATAMIFALSLFVLFAMGGAAIDFARWHDAHTTSEAAIDSALLAAARLMQVDAQPDAAIAAAANYYKAKTRSVSGIVDDSVSFEIDTAAASVRARGSSYLKTAMLGLIGIDRLQIVSSAKAAYPKGGGSNIEVSLMLDFTGSMCDDGKGPCASSANVDALKSAASEFVDILIPDTAGTATTRIALVPFAGRVRVADGSDGVMMKWLTNLDNAASWYYNYCLSGSAAGRTGEGSGTWTCTSEEVRQAVNWLLRPCVTERAYGDDKSPNSLVDYTDDAPGPGRWIGAHGGDRYPVSVDSAENPYPTPLPGSTASDPYGAWNHSDTPGYCSGDHSMNNVIQPLTADKSLLQSRIAAFEAGGTTAGVTATQWSWYMLSPKWRNIWSGSSEPGPYSDLTVINANGVPTLRKIAVMMTDGVYNAFRANQDQDPVKVSAHALALCSNMKAQGIEIYTVGFDLGALQASDAATADNLLKSCATDLSHYYSPSGVSSLKAAFRDIAMKVSPVHLTQ